MAPNAAAADLVGGGLTAAGGGFGHSERTYRMLGVVPHLLGADTPPLQVSGELGAEMISRHIYLLIYIDSAGRISLAF